MENLAWALSGGFGIDKLGLEERPRREPGHGEARVRIEWVSLNRRDLLLLGSAAIGLPLSRRSQNFIRHLS